MAPPYCTGCKTCFFHGEDKCPHADKVLPLWQAMLRADLIVFSYPVYALRAPAQVKSLLDHLCVHWFVHRPKPAMFPKHAVILTQAIGFFYRAALRDVENKPVLAWRFRRPHGGRRAAGGRVLGRALRKAASRNSRASCAAWPRGTGR